jgi:hypothetical protein
MPHSDHYALSRVWAIETETQRLAGLRDRAMASQARCQRPEDRDCEQARIDVFTGLLAALERAASGAAPERVIPSAGVRAMLAAASERRVG